MRCKAKPTKHREISSPTSAAASSVVLSREKSANTSAICAAMIRAAATIEIRRASRCAESVSAGAIRSARRITRPPPHSGGKRVEGDLEDVPARLARWPYYPHVSNSAWKPHSSPKNSQRRLLGERYGPTTLHKTYALEPLRTP